MAKNLKVMRSGPFVAVISAAADTADVLVYEQIGETFWGYGMTAKRFKSLLADVQREGKKPRIRINSGGGEIYDGLAIAAAIREFEGGVETVVDGLAASMASVIFLAGKTRTIQPGAMVMIHEPSGYVWGGDAEAMIREGNLLDKIGGSMADLYAKSTGMDAKEVRKMMKATTWMTAEEALEYKFATAVTTIEAPQPGDEDTEPELAQFGMSASELVQGWDLSKVASGAPPYTPAAAGTVGSRTMNFVPQAKATPVPFAEIEQLCETAAPSSTPQTTQEQSMSLTKEQREAESKRKAAIRAHFAKMPPEHLKLLDECLDDFDCTPELAASKLLTAMAAKSTPTGGGGVVPGAQAGADAREKFVTAASNVILVREGLDKMDAQNEFNGLSLRELAREGLRIAGITSIPGDPMRMIGMAFTTTSDFPMILENIARKSLLKGFAEAEETFEKWTSNGSLSDFKRASRVGLSEFSDLQKVPEHGEFKHGQFGERGEYVQLETYGKLFSMSRQAIINDDASAFTDIPRKMGRAAKRTVANNVYGVLTVNPVMRDGVQYLNTATHKNLSAVGAYPTIKVLDDMRTAMALQKDVQGVQNLNITPAVIVTSHKLRGIITELVRSKSFEGNNSGRENRILNMVEDIVADSRMDAADFGGGVGNGYAIFASPTATDTVEVNYLNGVQEPFMERMEGWNIDGTSYKVRIDTSATPLDFRTVQFNKGAAAPA